MRLQLLVLIFASLACAADMPTGYFRGAMVRWDGTPKIGVLSVRSEKDGAVYECHYDAKTYLEFEKHRVWADKYLEGDPLLLLVHRRPGETSCFILSGNVVPPAPKMSRTPSREELRQASLAKAARPAVIRHGTRRVSGVVREMSDHSFTLRTREGEDLAIALRVDTRYVGDGVRLQQSDVHVNQTLEVEAGLDADGGMEAFQLTWGTLSVHP